MGGKQPKQPEPEPQKSMKDLCKEFTRKIKRMQREFDREINKFEQSNNKIRMDIRKMLEKGESKNNIKLVAANVQKNQNSIKKYQRLNAQLNDVLYQIQSSASTETLVEVMKGMSSSCKMLKMTTNEQDMKDIGKVMQDFNTQLDKQNIINDQISDMMEGDDDIDDDMEIDNIIEQEQRSIAQSNENMNGNMNQNAV